MMGFNTAVVGLGILPHCSVMNAQHTLGDYVCGRPRGTSTFVTEGADILLYDQGDAVSVTCADCAPYVWCEADQPTPADAHYCLFVDQGNVYARLFAGREKAKTHISGKLRRADGSSEIVMRSVTSRR